MKRAFVIALCLVMLTGLLSGCGKKNNGMVGASPTTDVTVTNTPIPTTTIVPESSILPETTVKPNHSATPAPDKEPSPIPKVS